MSLPVKLITLPKANDVLIVTGFAPFVPFTNVFLPSVNVPSSCIGVVSENLIVLPSVETLSTIYDLFPPLPSFNTTVSPALIVLNAPLTLLHSYYIQSP